VDRAASRAGRRMAWATRRFGGNMYLNEIADDATVYLYL
jgi:hypothetical protein